MAFGEVSIPEPPTDEPCDPYRVILSMAPSSKSTRRALLVGINRYPNLPEHRQLFGAVRDAENLAEVLERRFDFMPDDLHLLLDEQANRTAVLRQLDDLIAETEASDILVFHWSGHGSQCPAPSGLGHVTEPDGLAETLVPHDARAADNPEPGDILDDEIRQQLARLHRKGAFVTLIFDCCHSGHVYRAVGPRERWTSPADRRPLHLKPQIETDHRAQALQETKQSLRVNLGQRQVVLAACRDDESASERLVTVDGQDGLALVHGHFTWSLLRELKSEKPAATAGEVFRRACTRMLAENTRQTPQFAGADERLLFGIEARHARPWLRVCEVGLEAERCEVELEGGMPQQIEVGSLWQLHAPGTARPTRRSRLGLVEVLEVSAFRSRARIVRRLQRPVEINSRAYLHRPARGEARLPVVFEVDQGVASAAIVRSPYLRIAGEADCDPVRVHRVSVASGIASTLEKNELGAVKEDVWALCDAKDVPFAIVPASAGILSVRRRLERNARYRQALRLKNPDHRRRPAGLSLHLLDPPPGDGPDKLPCYRENDRIRFEIVHQHNAPLYLYVFNFGLADEICQIFPLPGAEEMLDPGRPLSVGVDEDDEFYVSLPDEIAPPAAPNWRQDGGVEFLVLFATSEPTDFRILTSEKPIVPRGTSTLQSWLVPNSSSAMRSAGDWWHVVRVPYRLFRR